MQPIIIPPTSQSRYLSFNRALNLRLEDELTGDWHFKVAFFCDSSESPKTASLAGNGQRIDTNCALGGLGVRDMAHVLAAKKVRENTGPVYVANHFRAITDLAFDDFLEDRTPGVITPQTVNQWLDTDAQVRQLIDEYLWPLRAIIDEPMLSQINCLIEGLRG